MANFRARTADGRTVDDIAPATLRPLLTEASGTVIMEGPAGQLAEASSAADGRWRIEVATAADAPREAATVPNADAAFDALRSWAADDDWWREAFSWSPVS
ncbi:hypothetical protein [Microlunatus speluncae]|uniref:hypothetical protein n=1 Tax=Microlunatus speluncae TaxID=2594267 RepID=UPI0012660C67|nr:hypothetical protein [Microlunatus speluncae]